MKGRAKNSYRNLIIVSTVIFLGFVTAQFTFSAVPGLDLQYYAGGTFTWTTDSASPFTGLVHEVRVIDYDGISADGTSHTVTVTYPNSGLTKTLFFNHRYDDYSALYDLYDGDIAQPMSAVTYTGDYVFRVIDHSSSESSEAVDHVAAAPLNPPVESTFSPNFTTPHSITAFFDNVYANGALYDNFSAGFDGTKWSGPPSYVTYENGEARFDVDFNPGRGSYWLSMTDPGSVDQIKATVRIASITGTDGDIPRARLAGTFCHDSWGDVYAGLHLRGNDILYGVNGERWEGGHLRMRDYIPLTVLGSAVAGNRYDFSIDWDESTTTFRFRVEGLDDSVDYSATYTVSGPVGAADDPYKGISVASWNYLDDTTGTFDWDTVPNAKYYRVRVYDLNDNTLWRGYTALPPYRLPPGLLMPNVVYKYRIDAINDHQWLEWDNAARSEPNQTRFITGPVVAQAPYLDLWSVGATTWNNPWPFGTYTFFHIRIHDAQGVPENIQSVTATLPAPLSTVINLYLNYTESPTYAVYRGVYFDTPLAGEYTFTVTDKDGNSDVKTEMFEPDPLGHPSESTLQPSNNVLVGETGVDFDWEDVISPDAKFYELNIYDKNYRYLFNVKTTDSAYTLPPGLLEENSLYRYRIYSRAEFFEENNDNSSTSPPGGIQNANTFHTTKTIGLVEPQLSLGKFGVAVWHGPHPETGAPTYALEFFPFVSDGDGVPENIKKVEVTYPGGTTKRLNYDNSPDWGSTYYASENYTNSASIQHVGNSSGVYEFKVEDFEGNVVSMTDTLTDISNVIDWTSSTLPVDGTTVRTLTPTITWNPVSGAQHYKVRIMSAYTSPTVHWSPELTGTSYTIPADVLKPNETYGYRVYAYREPIGSDVDYYSSHRSWHNTNTRFTIPDTPAGSNIEIVPIDSTTGETPITLNFDQVTDPGRTTLVTAEVGGPLPSGFKPGNPPLYYDLETTATFTGSIEICIDYTAIFFENEAELKLYQETGSSWVEVTTTLDTANDIICGDVNSLSPLAIVEPDYCKGDLNGDGAVDGVDLSELVNDFDCAAGCSADVDGDDDVDYADLFWFSRNFGRADCAVSP